MKESITKQWIQMLRSGKFTQTKRYLARKEKNNQDYSYCCLGVLCELMIKETGKKSLKIREIDQHKEYGIENVSGVLPKEVKEWSGIKNAAVNYLNSENKPLSLVRDNDSGKSFKQIANIIKHHWKEM